MDCGSTSEASRSDVPPPPKLFLGLHQDRVLRSSKDYDLWWGNGEIKRDVAAGETLTSGQVKLLVPPLSTLVVGPTREKAGDFVLLSSVSIYGLDDLNTLCVHPMTYTRAD
jgi:hypothetical protein